MAHIVVFSSPLYRTPLLPHLPRIYARRCTAAACALVYSLFVCNGVGKWRRKQL